MKKHQILVVSLFVAASQIFRIYPLLANPMDLQFERISIDEGLSQSSVLAIVQDEAGFMWFGTYEGLNRYDGFEFKVYKSDPANPYSLSQNNIETLLIDSKGRLWAGSEDGLNQFDRETDSFTKYRHDPKNRNSLSYNFIRCLLEDHTGNIWIGTYGGGLNVFNPETKTFYRFKTDISNPTAIPHNNVLSLLEDSQQQIWVGTDLGLCLFNPSDSTFTRFQHDPGNPNSISQNGISCMYEDGSGNLWFGTWGSGLNRLDKKSGHFIHYHFPDNPLISRNRDVIRSILEDNTGRLWIGTDEAGMIILDLSSDHYVCYQTNPNNLQSISSNSINSMYQDRSGIIWLGTNFAGINKYDPKKGKFIHYRHNPDDPNSLNNNSVMSLFEDSYGILWIGTNGHGLNRFDRKNHRFTHFLHNSKNETSISDNLVRSICEDGHRNLWVATDNGLNRYDRKTNQFHHYHMDTDNPASISYPTSMYLYPDKEGSLWIGTVDGLNRYDETTDSFICYMNDPNDSTSLSNNFIWTIIEDNTGHLWVGTNLGGLNRLNPSTGIFEHFFHDPNRPGSLSENKVLCIHQDHEGTLWFGTTNRLNRWNPETRTFTQFGEKEGLPSSIIQGILEDDHGNLWISSNKGLSKFNPKSLTFQNFNKTHGLQSNEFNVNACVKLHDGEMAFGGLNGFNIFHPDSLKQDPTLPPVILTNFQIFNKPVGINEVINGRIILNQSISTIKELSLTYKENVFSFQFAALNYTAPKNNQYAYMMRGFDKDWNMIGNRHFVTYTNLPAGKYVFRVKASNSDNIWNEEGASLKIKITPPLWDELWFRILAVILVILGIWIIYTYRVREIQRHRNTLETQVRERTADLEYTNKELTKQKLAIQKYAKDLKNSNEELEQFAYVASHDLQEPLRMVSSYLSLLVKRYKDKLDDEGLEFIHYATDGAERMRRLINDLLSYSRVTSKGHEFVDVDCEQMIQRVEMNLKVISEDKHATITHDFLPVVRGDEIQIERLFQNLVGNAIKYCDHNPVVHVRVEEKETFYEFAIKDNGIGIDPSQFERIFGIFQRLHHKNAYTGTGIGLAVCKKIVERHNGKIWVESEPGKGSTFYFTIPKRKE